MPRKQIPMKRESFLIVGGAPPIPVKSIEREQWIKYRDKMLENTGKIMSDYYTYKLSQMMENK